MLFNGKFVFCQFPMLFNRNLRLEKLPGGGRMDVRTDGPTDGRLEIQPCVLQGPLPQKKSEGRVFHVTSSD